MKVAVLHIVWNLEVGGIQTWLLALAKYFDREHFIVDFGVYEDCAGGLTDEITALGCRVFVLGKEPERELSAYDIVQLHFCPWQNPLRLAKVRLRIFHNHNSLVAARKIYRGWGGDCADARFSVSHRAARYKFGWRSQLPGYYTAQPAGIDLAPFYPPCNREEVRRALGIPDGCFVVGHVGRLTEFKNHAFLLEIVSHLRGDWRLLLVGDGPERVALESRARQFGVESRIIFHGNTREVAELLRGAMDIFIFPSTVGEGLPLSLIEAQAAGLPCLVSDEISRESAVVDGLVHWRSLRQTAAQWAATAETLRGITRDTAAALQAVEASALNARKTVENLERFYRARLGDCVPEKNGGRSPRDFSTCGV